nr:ATP-binding protein [Pluralibacter gergoviae]
MTEAELLRQLALGEDSRHQFKRDATNVDSIAAELAAFSNSGGGQLFIGVEDDGSVLGLESGAVRRLNQLLSNAASQHTRPPVHPLTENVQTDNGIVSGQRTRWPCQTLCRSSRPYLGQTGSRQAPCDIPRRDAAHVPTCWLGVCRCGANRRNIICRYQQPGVP